MTLPATPADRHAAVAARFQELVDGTTDWSAQSPVPEWTARDVVRHLVEWAPALLAEGTGIELPAGPSVDDDPSGAFRHLTGQIQELLESAATATVTFSHPHIGTMPLATVLEQFYIPDVFMHAWDLARATGQDDTLDPETATEMNAGMRSQAEMIRGSGQFGEEQPVADDARDQEKLMAFVGRDPGFGR